MMEVIEHSPTPLAMLNAARNLLKPSGVVLITTPNKTVYRAAEYWQTDNPPVHLWWFSETSARRFAEKTRFDVGFWEFTRLHQSNQELHNRDNRQPTIAPMKPAFLDERGDVITGTTAPSSSAQKFFRKLKTLRDQLLPAFKDSKRSRRRRQARQRWADEHGDVMGVILTKPRA